MSKFFIKDQSGSLKFIVLLIILSMASVYIGFQAGNAFFARRTGGGEDSPAEEEIASEDIVEEDEVETDMEGEEYDFVEEEAEEPAEELTEEETEDEVSELPEEDRSDMQIDRDANYLVQTGAFGREENAETRVAELREQGFSAFVSGDEPYRVQVVGGDNRAEAEDVANELREAGYEVFVHSQ